MVCPDDISEINKEIVMTVKTLDNSTTDTAVDQVKDLKTWGNPDMWKLICKASSKSEGWMKSTKAMEIRDVGCLVQVTTQQTYELHDTEGSMGKAHAVAEAITFVPRVRIVEGELTPF